MRFAVDAWDPSYAPNVGFDEDVDVRVDPGIELPAAQWRPIHPRLGAAADVAFVDGVRRVEARVWLASSSGELDLAGQCASWAAGAVTCVQGAVAVVDQFELGRTLVTGPPGPAQPIETEYARYAPVLAASADLPAMWLAVQEEMARGERRIAERIRAARPDSLLVLDGPLRGRDHLDRTVGYIKSHHVDYLPNDLRRVTDQLGSGERTPLFLVAGSHPRLSWYVRLASAASATPLAGCARCEVPANSSAADAAALADIITATLVRFASDPVRERRAPQNLTPIAGLERHLRHRLGDQRLMERALRAAAHDLTRTRQRSVADTAA